MFFNVCLHSLSFPLLVDRRKSDSLVKGEPRGNWRQDSNSRDVVASSPWFPRPAARAPRRTSSQATSKTEFRAPEFDENDEYGGNSDLAIIGQRFNKNSGDSDGNYVA